MDAPANRLNDPGANGSSEPAAEVLARTQARLAALFEHAPEPIFIKDADGRYVEVSRTFLDLAGREIDEVIGRTDEDIFDPAVAAHFGEEDRRVRESGQPMLFEESFPYAGQTFTFLTQKFPLPFGEVAGIATNITERKAEQQLHEATAERLRLAIEGTGVGFYENNLEEGGGPWSESAFRVLGLEPTPDLVGRLEMWRSAVHPDDVERVTGEHAAAAARGGPWSVQFRVLRKDDGRVRWVRAYGQFTRRGGTSYSTGIAIDITDQKQLEEQQALLLSELNHRVKNMLAVVQSIAIQTFTRTGDAQEQRAAFEHRLMALARVHDLLQQDSGNPVSMGRLVERAVEPFAGNAARMIDWEGPDIELDTRKCVSLALALHELCTNAVKYGALSRDGGRVLIRWSAEPGQLTFAWTESGGPAVEPPARSGFGTRMLERALASDLGTAIRLEFAREGVRCRFSAPL